MNLQRFGLLVTGFTQASTGQPLQQGYDQLVPGLTIIAITPLQSDGEAFSFTQLSLPIEERHINGGNTTELVICVISQPSQRFGLLVTGFTQASTGQPLQQGYYQLVPGLTIIAITPLHGTDI